MFDQRMRLNALRDARRKHIAIDGERTAARDTRRVGRLQDHAAEQPHLGLEQAVRVDRLGALERVRADQLREPLRLVGWRLANWTHLVEYHATAALGELPRGFTAGQPPTDNVNRTNVMNRHVLRIAPRRSRADRRLLLLVGVVAACSSSSQATPELDVPSSDEAWVASACQPASIDTTGWRHYRLGDLTIEVPSEYRPSGAPDPYRLVFRGPGGSLMLYMHRSVRDAFDGSNSPRRGQNWCNGSLGGNRAEILSWFEPFTGQRRDTRGGELVLGATYNFVAQLPASWGGQDEGKWLFIRIGASRLRDARALRDAVHTIRPAKDPGSQR